MRKERVWNLIDCIIREIAEDFPGKVNAVPADATTRREDGIYISSHVPITKMGPFEDVDEEKFFATNRTIDFDGKIRYEPYRSKLLKIIDEANKNPENLCYDICCYRVEHEEVVDFRALEVNEYCVVTHSSNMRTVVESFIKSTGPKCDHIWYNSRDDEAMYKLYLEVKLKVKELMGLISARKRICDYL